MNYLRLVSGNTVIKGPSFESIRNIAVSQITVPLEESPRIQVNVNDDKDKRIKAAFYEQKKLNKSAEVCISIHGQLVDFEGVRCVYFSFLFCAI